MWNAVLSPPGSRIKDVLGATASLPELKRLLIDLTLAQGIRYYLIQIRLSPDSLEGMPNSPDILITNAPAGWSTFCAGNAQSGGNGPLIDHMMKRSTPLPWRELALSDPGFFQHAASFGVASGITHIVHGSGQSWSLMSHMWDTAGDATEARIDASVAMGQLLACYAHDAVHRILCSEPKAVSQEPAQIKLPALTPRERECLSLAATGRTALQIAGALSITERTVAFHLAHARQRLGVKNSRQAYVKALSMGLISVG